jgi:hypothetical protein
MIYELHYIFFFFCSLFSINNLNISLKKRNPNQTGRIQRFSLKNLNLRFKESIKSSKELVKHFRKGVRTNLRQFGI